MSVQGSSLCGRTWTSGPCCCPALPCTLLCFAPVPDYPLRTFSFSVSLYSPKQRSLEQSLFFLTAAGFDQEVIDGGGSAGGRDGLNLYAQEKLAIWRGKKERVSNDVWSKQDVFLSLYRRCLDDITDLEVLEFDAEDGAKTSCHPSQARAERPGARPRNPDSGVPPGSGLFGVLQKAQTDSRAHLGFSL